VRKRGERGNESSGTGQTSQLTANDAATEKRTRGIGPGLVRTNPYANWSLRTDGWAGAGEVVPRHQCTWYPTSGRQCTSGIPATVKRQSRWAQKRPARRGDLFSNRSGGGWGRVRGAPEKKKRARDRALAAPLAPKKERARSDP